VTPLTSSANILLADGKHTSLFCQGSNDDVKGSVSIDRKPFGRQTFDRHKIDDSRVAYLRRSNMSVGQMTVGHFPTILIPLGQMLFDQMTPN
jgi:hypothetical protein